jgi:DNA-binding transcriptional MerR regulator
MIRKNIPMDHLMNQRVLHEVDELIRRHESNIKVSIGEVKDLTGATYTQLRYWEKLGLLSPQRGPESRPIRQYTLHDLKRALWLARYFSSNGGTPKKALDMLRQETPGDLFLSKLLESTSYGPTVSFSIEEHIRRASQFPLFHFLAPRVAKACLSLICGGLKPNTGFAVSMEQPNNDDDKEKDLNTALMLLGKSLLCFYDERGLTSLMVKDVLYWADSKMSEYAEESFGRIGPAVIIGVGKQGLGEIVRQRDHHYQAFERMLVFLVDMVRAQEKVDHLSHVYAVHSGSELGVENRLDALANTAVALGASDHWLFCCILAPDSRDAIWDEVRLRVVGYSEKSPHDRDVVLGYREGVSSRAYRDGQMVYVRDISQELGRIAKHSAERNVQSAIAVPVFYGKRCKGVMYLASDRKGAFDDPSSEIILALLALAVAQVLVTSSAASGFDDMIEQAVKHPRVSDPKFANFGTRDDFKAAVIKKIRETQNESTSPTIWVLAADINQSRRIRLKDGTREEWAVRQCWQYVGEKMLWLLRQSPLISNSHDCDLYRTKVDQYVTILEDIQSDLAREFTSALQKTLNTLPEDLECESDRDGIDDNQLNELNVRVALWKGSRGFLLNRINMGGKVHAIETLIRLIEETLEHARRHGLVAFRNENEPPTEIVGN